MARLTRKHWWRIDICGGTLLVVILFASVSFTYWSGFTKLEIVFAVSDLAGQPIPGAQVEIRSYGGMYAGGEMPPRWQDGHLVAGWEDFTITADLIGQARTECLENFCHGSWNVFRVELSFQVHTPCWQYRVTAREYEPSEWTRLNCSEARRDGRGRAKCVVKTQLRPSQQD
jgi:hypothetical protein